MTALKQDAYALLDGLTDEMLAIIVRYLRRLENEMAQEDMNKRRKAFETLQSMIKPIPEINEKIELALWREEKFGYAGTD